MERLLVGVLTAFGLLAGASVSAADFAVNVDPSGVISLPADFRTKFTHLGSWVLSDPDSPGHGFHDVYASPEAVDEYRKTGHFPDGTVLVKEIRSIAKGPMTTGAAAWADMPMKWFVMVKDGKGRFPGSPLWKDGWGWALFTAGNPGKNIAASYETACKSCHEPAASTDRVYIQGYPALTGR